MLAIMRRELAVYFRSPVGYIFLAVFYFFAGYFFFASNLFGMNADLGGVFGGMYTLLLFLIPILTMRLLSEERGKKTEQALLTAPVTLTGMVIGKYLAAVAVFAIGLSVTLVYALVIATMASPNWAMVFGNLIATLLLGMALIAIGVFISSLTENQVIAAVGGFGVGLGFLLLGALQAVFTGALGDIIGAVSFHERYHRFSLGIFRFEDILFFVSVAAVFLFLSVRVFEKRRWS
ncbi:MAG: ABC transporter permease subunit [Oscillospiraceae bacterium]|nr:ABC transporter permease subunit [Oscillospiraceae bacterium]